MHAETAAELDNEFSVDSYAEHQMQIPGLDGFQSEKLSVALAGSLDRTDADDLAFLSSLRMGQRVTLEVEAIVAQKGYALAGGGEALGYRVGLKVVNFLNAR